MPTFGKQRANNSSGGRLLPAELISIIFALIALGIFWFFLIRHPVDWLQPETLRLRYYGLQAGLREGPLSAAFNRYDLEKPLVWEAQGGMFDGRYPIMLLDALIPKIYQPFYSLWGPSLREPINLVLILLTWIFLFLLIREWFGSRSAALIAASSWLLTSQTLLDAHFPIRPNMAILTLLLVYLFWELIRLRRIENKWPGLVRVSIALTAAVYCHEFGFNFVPLVWILLCLEHRHFRGWLLAGLGVSLIPWAVYLVALLWILPPLAARVVGCAPPMDWMTGGMAPLLADPFVILSRVRDFVLVGVREMFNQNLGAGVHLSPLFRLAGPLAVVVVLLMGDRRSWRAALVPLVPAVLYFLAVALLMFPVIPSTVEMPVYYYSTIIVLFIPPLGAFLSGISSRGATRRWLLLGAALLVVGVLNYRQSSLVLEEMPAAFGFHGQARDYTRDVLSLPPLRRAESFFAGRGPIYPAYPRPRAFDISRRWDIMLRVWHGQAEHIFSMMMPVLNLRLYESDYLIGDPGEFAALEPEQPGEYESRARLYWDMPARHLVDLGRLRVTDLPPDHLPGAWRSLDPPADLATVIRGEVGPGLLGEQLRALLPPGRWGLEIAVPDDLAGQSVRVCSCLRADLMPSGPDDVMDRVTPLPLRSCRILIRDGEGREVFSGRQTYGWSYQLFQVTLPWSEKWELVIESEGEVEVLGPALAGGGDEAVDD